MLTFRMELCAVQYVGNNTNSMEQYFLLQKFPLPQLINCGPVSLRFCEIIENLWAVW